MNGEVKELRLRVARLEGAAKRLLDGLGWPADGRQGPEATVEALRAAADAAGKAAGGKREGQPGKAGSGTGVRGCRGIGVEPPGQQTANGEEKRWEF